MTRDQVRALLAYAAAGTRDWTPTTVDVDLWLDLLGDLAYDDARAALHEHASRTHHRPVPADLIAGVKRLRADRLDRTPDQVPDADPDQPDAYTEALRDGRYRVASGVAPRDVPALTGVFPSPPGVDWHTQPSAGRAAITSGLPAVDDEQRMAQARAEVAAREIVPLPDGDDIDARIDVIHGPGAAAALDRAIADGTIATDDGPVS